MRSPTVAPRSGPVLRTGDLGKLDADGRLTVTGRRADTIVSGGENVAPTEVEAVLEAHPAVAEAFVDGVPDPRWGEAVVAEVVLKIGAEAAEADLRDFCASPPRSVQGTEGDRVRGGSPQDRVGQAPAPPMTPDMNHRLLATAIALLLAPSCAPGRHDLHSRTGVDSITAALAQAGDGDTIHVRAGSYAEQPMTVAHAVPDRGRARHHGHHAAGDPAKPVFTVTHDGVTITGLTATSAPGGGDVILSQAKDLVLDALTLTRTSGPADTPVVEIDAARRAAAPRRSRAASSSTPPVRRGTRARRCSAGRRTAWPSATA